MKATLFTAALLCLVCLPAFGQVHPYELPEVNFQGRIEVGGSGYSGTGHFRFSIGEESESPMSNIYWGPSTADTTVVEGVYNINLGADTSLPLDKTYFSVDRDYYLKVEFSTDGSNYEELTPYQEILTVPFAVNADLLDGYDGSYYLAHGGGGGGGGSAVRWVELTYSGSGDTLTIQAGDSYYFAAGMPLRYGTGGSWNYGMVTNLSGTTATVAGIAVPAAVTLQAGFPEMLRQIVLLQLGNLPGNNSDDWGPPTIWQLRDSSYAVRATAKLKHATGTNDAHIAIGIGAVGSDLLTGVGYITLPAESTAAVSSTTNINSTNYVIEFGDQIYVNVDQFGTAYEPGTDLLVILDIVTP